MNGGPGRNRLVWLGLVLLAMLMLASRPAEAQVDRLEVDVVAGFDGYFKPGRWTPVFVTITNRAPNNAAITTDNDFVGQLLISSRPEKSDVGAVRYLRPIDVPVSSAKTFALYAKFPGSVSASPPKLELNSSNGRLLSQFPLSIQPSDPSAMLVVYVTDQISVPPLPTMRGGLDFTRRAKIASRLLPDHWAGYDSADVLVFPKWPDQPPGEDRIEAIREWVIRGGTLVFLTGKNGFTYGDEAASSMMPVTLHGGVLLNQSEDRRTLRLLPEGEKAEGTTYLLSKAVPRPGTEVIREFEGVPLVARRPMGNGQVVFFAADLESASRTTEDLFGEPWFSIMPLPNHATNEEGVVNSLKNIKTATGRAARPPQYPLIILICLLYMVVVGPVNFYLLGRKGRLEWAWFTIPVIVFTFFILIYTLGVLTKGSSNIVRELTYLRTQGDSDLGAATTVVGTFVSQPGRYFVRPGGRNAAVSDPYMWAATPEFRVTDMQFMIGASAPDPLGTDYPIFTKDEQTNNLVASTWKMGMYDARAFVVESAREDIPRVGGKLEWDQDSLRGQVRNDSQVDYDRAFLIAGTRMVEIPGGLKSGATHPVDLRLVIPQIGASTASNSLSMMLETLIPTARLQSEQVSTANFGITMLGSLFPPNGGTLVPPQNSIYFVGYRETAEPKDSYTNLDPDETSAAQVVMTRLNPAPPRGRDFIVTSPFLQYRLHEHNLDTPQGVLFIGGGSRPGDREQLTMTRAYAVFSAELPFQHPDLQVNSVTINPVVDEQRADEDVVVAVYQHAPQAGWVRIQPGTALPNSNIALPGSGRVFFRIQSTKQQEPKQEPGWNARTKISSLNVTLQGTVRR